LQPQSWAELSRSLTEKSNSAPSVPSMPDRIEQLDFRSALPLATAGTQEIQLNRSAHSQQLFDSTASYLNLGAATDGYAK